ncbi:Cyclic di-GMP phosphodiesterase Gmr [compost metagenome]
MARLGGDEFVLVCESIGSPQQAEALAARILEALGQPFHLQGQDIRIGASIGISFGLECGCGDDLLREADQAMYRAKAAGRNRMHLGRLHPAGQPLGEPTQPDES